MIYDLIIIGGGPAGMTAGIYAGRQKMSTLLITKDFGGQVGKKAIGIENYPGFQKISGQELIKNFKKHLETTEIEISIDEVGAVRKDNNFFIVETKNGKRREALSVIVATGSDPRMLEVPGEKEFLGKGVSYCSLCDGPLFKNKEVAVVGGGNSGFETAIFLLNYVKKVYILESGSKPKADAENQEIVEKSGKSEIITNTLVKEIRGDNFVEELVYQDVNGRKNILKISGVFVEVGYHPATSFVRGLVDFNERDEIKVSYETMETRTPGLFAAGDANIGRYKQIITACGEGAVAAVSLNKYLEQN